MTTTRMIVWVSDARYLDALATAYLAAPEGSDEEREIEFVLNNACKRLGVDQRELVRRIGEVEMVEPAGGNSVRQTETFGERPARVQLRFTDLFEDEIVEFCSDTGRTWRLRAPTEDELAHHVLGESWEAT